jgi:hypothetical protein
LSRDWRLLAAILIFGRKEKQIRRVARDDNSLVEQDLRMLLPLTGGQVKSRAPAGVPLEMVLRIGRRRFRKVNVEFDTRVE